MSDKVSKEDMDNTGEVLSSHDRDTIGEIGNIFMGSAATTLSQLLNNRVEITTPQVELFNNIKESYVIEEDQLIVEITYKEGLQGTAVLALKKSDSAVIADLMMGGSGKVESAEIGELQISAVGEAMNQMVGTASTSLSGMLNTAINISPPEIKLMEKDKDIEISQDLLTEPIVAIKFKLAVAEVLNSEITQFMSVNAAKTQVAEVDKMMKNMSDDLKSDLKSDGIVDSLAAATPTEGHSSPIGGPAPPPEPQEQVTVQPVQFSSLDKTSNVFGETNRNLNLVMDVKLELTVELGRTELPIKNVLELTRGSIIELEKIAGEPVELYANGKLIARGEVVVIEDNFGLRITSIISPEKRIQEL